MNPTESSNTFGDFDHRLLRPPSNFPLVPPQPYGNIPLFVRGMPPPGPVYPPCSSNQPSIIPGFLQHFNFSVPPPVPPVLAASSHMPRVPYSDCRQPAPPQRVSNEFDPMNFFASEKFKSIPTDRITKKTAVQRPIQLHDFSNQLKNFHSYLMKLKSDLENLNSVGSQLDTASWKDRVASLLSQRDTLRKLKRTINIDSSSLALLKYKIKKRQKKRERGRKKNLIKTKSVSKYEIAYSHMQQLQQIVDKQKQEEQFKSEADSVLFSVRQKKSEANGQIQLLTALSKLHAARINAANSQNKQSLCDAVSGFNKIIDKLKSMWQRQLEEYLIEENGVKVMLNDLVVIAEDEDCKNLKKTCGQWLKLLFGTTSLQEISYISDYDELIEIRNEWDKYVVFEEANSSKIPPGWVIPKYHSDDAWSKFVS